MSDGGGPWGRMGEAPAPAPRNSRPALWVLLLFAVGGLVVALARAYPGAVRTRDDWFSVTYAIGFAALVSAGLLRAGRATLTQHLRNVAIWGAIIAILALGFSYRDELVGVSQRLRVALSAGDPVATGDHELAIPQDENGAFVIIGRVNGQRVRFLVDTGATDTVLSPDDAQRVGVDMARLRYDQEAETANGVGHGAAWTAGSLEVGPIRMANVKIAVNQAPLSNSLLGLNFLNRLESFEVRGRKLILKWREGR